MKLTIYHPQGNANVRASALAFEEAGILHEYHTSIACFEGSYLNALARFGPFAEFKRRKLDPSLEKFTKTSPTLEMARILASKGKFKDLIRHETGVFSVAAVTRNLDKKVAGSVKNAKQKGLSGIYAYEDGAVQSFRAAKKLGLQCIYDLPTGYWRAKLKILEAEKLKFPEWQNTIRALIDSEQKLSLKDEEIALADKIIVASRFTASTLSHYPAKLPPVHIVPYGFPPVTTTRTYSVPGKSAPIKLLFVGNLSQQKGIANLFEAIKGLENKVSLTLIGKKATDDCAPMNSALEQHRYINGLPHNQVLEEMRSHDILVFPSLFDGFGLVITEAMSQGTPVITTQNSAGPDLIEHGKNGWLVEAGSTEQLRAAIEHLIEHPEEIAEAGKAAMDSARLRPWSVFRKELAEAVNK
ncbi:MAG: glycosyltransferase family 4 protein [Ferruginibacter sp.]|nr:glycosyltransferase family 4 protein [Ferruginibacter sp.]